jgi:hypothetical protein
MDLTGARWRKSTRSGNNGGNRGEVARKLPGIVAVRDSKDSSGPVLIFTPDAWQAFTAKTKSTSSNSPELRFGGSRR